ncbi:MAG: recombinase family protein, partial [Abditibacteriaceae bacterium]
DYIKMKKWRVAKVRKDVASGKNDERAGFQELLTDIRLQKVDVVTVYRLDRLSRNVRDIYQFLETIRESKVGFVSVTEGFDTTTAMGRAMLGVAAVFAQLTREMIAENTKDGLMRRAEAGFYTGNLKMLFGYNYSKEVGLVPDALESAHVKQIFDWYTEHKWGTEKIAKMLNLRKMTTKTGVQWTQGTIGVMIRNQVYCGDVRSNGEFIEGRHKGIIDKEQFELAQAIINSRSTIPSRAQSSRHLLSGIAHCSECGKNLVSHSINQGPEKKRYDFYRHNTVVKTGTSCKAFLKSASILESAVIDQIGEIALSGDIQKVLLQDVRKRHSNKHVPTVKERDKLLIEMAGMGEKFSQWADRLDAGRIDEDQFDRQNAKLLERKNVVQEKLAIIDAELSQEENLEVSLAEVQSVLKDFPKMWQGLELEERREVLRLLIEELKVSATHAELKLLFLEPVIISLTAKKAKATS